jgi:hypothetical protein
LHPAHGGVDVFLVSLELGFAPLGEQLLFNSLNRRLQGGIIQKPQRIIRCGDLF